MKRCRLVFGRPPSNASLNVNRFSFRWRTAPGQPVGFGLNDLIHSKDINRALLLTGHIMDHLQTNSKGMESGRPMTVRTADSERNLTTDRIGLQAWVSYRPDCFVNDWNTVLTGLRWWRLA